MKKNNLNKKKFRLIFGGILLLILVIFIGLKLWTNNKVKAAWFDDSFGYRKSFSFTHNAALTNRRVTITIDTATLISAGKMQSSCNDSRFTDISGTLLAFQLTGSCNNASTTYDVVFPTIINGTNTTYFYYGNPVATNASSDVSGYTSLSPSGGSPSAGSEEKSLGPIAYWKFDEGQGQIVNDGSGNGNNGTLGANSGTASDDPTWTTEDQCISGKCLKFDATNTLVQLPLGASVKNLAAYTVETWINIKTLPSNNNGKVIYDESVNGDNSTGRVFIEVIKGTFDSCTGTYTLNFGFRVGGGGSTRYDVCGTTTLQTDTWYHVVAVFDSINDVHYIYLNGKVDGTLSQAVTAVENTNPAANPIIGTYPYLSNYFGGYIDGVKIYRYARSQAQINTDYIKGAANKGSSAVLGMADQSYLSNGLVGYWKMDETSWTNDCSTLSVLDSSGNSYNGKSCPNTTGPTAPGSGKFGNGGVFDGINDYLKVDNFTSQLANKSSMTMSGWVKPSNNPSNHNFYFGIRNDSSADFYVVQLSGSNSLECRFRNSSGTAFTTSNTVTPSVWQLVTLVYDGKNVTCYVNGVAGTSVAASGVITTTTDAFFIAGNNANYSTASIDDVRVYNRALFPAEVNNLYNWAPGPVGYWKMDEGTGTTTSDISGNGNSGTLTNGPTWATGKFGKAINFDGSDDYIDAGTGSGNITGDLTLETWFKTSDTTNNINLISKGASSDWLYDFYKEANNRLSCKIYQQNSGAGYLLLSPSGTTINDGMWHYGVCVLSGTTLSLYIDGKFISSTSSTTGTRDTSSAGHLFVGTFFNPGSTGNWNGLVDDVKIYNYARTPSQIIEDMNGGHPVGGSPIGSQIIYWKLNEQNGTTINNSGFGGSTYNGTNSGAAWLTNTTCKVNGCLNFDTTTDNVSAGDVAFVDGLTGMTASFWLNPQTLATNKMILSKANNTTQRVFQIKTDNTTAAKLKVMISSSASDTSNYCVTSASVLSASTWQHVVVIYDGTQSSGTDTRVKVYVNGVLKSCTVTGTIPTSLVSSTTSNFKLGQGDDSTPTALLTYIDEVKVYNTALTTDQVKIDYNAGLSVNYAVGASPEATQLNDGAGNSPVGYWNFDEGNGTTANDKSGNGNTGTWNGTLGNQWSAGKYGKGGNFDGTTNYVDIGSPSVLNLTQFSLSLWWKGAIGHGSGGDSFAGPFNNRLANKNGFQFANEISSNTSFQPHLVIWNGTSEAANYKSATAYSLPFTSWMHFEWTYDGSTAKLYVNGIPQTVSSSSTTNYPEIGVFIGAGYNYNAGQIDDVKVYDYARTAAQVAYDYNRGASIAWYKFDECQGTTANDSSGNGLNGVITITATGGNTNGVGTCNTATSAWGTGTTGKFNSSVFLDGNGDFVNIYSSAFNSAFSGSRGSVSMWAKVSGSSVWTDGTNRGLITLYVDNNNYLTIYKSSTSNTLEADYLAGGIGDGDVITSSTTDWFNFTVTWDKTTDSMKTYINGILKQSFSTLGNWVGSLSSTQTVIAALDTSASSPWNGQIDDTRIYNYALSASQIQKLYNDNFSVFYGPTTGTP
ncbi:hypothetical protein BH10PAT1_BH10PAT1_1790 [soil metagenome]